MARLTSHRGVVLSVLVGLILLFFNKMAFSNLILARGDTFLYFYPYWQGAADALRSGRVPLWNPDIFMGAPFLANSQVGFFYPLNWPVWLLLPTPYAVSASILIHLAIAGGGAYLAARRTLSLGIVAALFAATLFALGGYLTAQVEHINQLQGLAWLPWFFVALAPLTRQDGVRKTWREHVSIMAAVGALFALQFLAGHTQTAFISGVAIATWLAVHALTGLKPNRSAALLSSGLVLGAGAGLAILLAAAQLMPTFELTGQSSRQGGLALNEVLSFSWHPLHITRALLPGYGQALFTEYVAFLPITALALAVVGAWAWRKNPAVRPWVVLVAVIIVLALGRFTPVYYLLGRLPGFDLFRAPARWLAVAALGVALLAGYGWQRLYDFTATDHSRADQVRARRELIRPLAFAGVGLVILILWGYTAAWLVSYVPLGAEAPFEQPLPLTLLGWLIEYALGALLFWVILTAAQNRARRATIDLIILVLGALWLGTRGLPYNQLTTPEAYFDLRPPQARLAALASCSVPDRACATPPDRFLSLSGILFDPGDLAEIEGLYADQLDPAAIYDYVVAVKDKEVLSPNLSMISGLPSVDGFDGGILPLRAYSEVMRLILPDGGVTTDGRLREYLKAAPDSRWLSLFNSRYLITDKTGDLWRDGVFFDQQHPVRMGIKPVAVAGAPGFDATELWLIADGSPPPVEVKGVYGEVWPIAPDLRSEPDLYQVVFPRPAEAESITILPCAEESPGCGVKALTLVDRRDETFQPLTMSPYRLIFSGDVKVYENLDALPRAFMVYDWQGVDDEAAAVEAMRAADFDPGEKAVVSGESPEATSGGGHGSVEILNYHPESITLRVETGQPGLLILTDAYYPGWEATVDGSPQTIRQVDGMFRGLFLPAGDHQVELIFRPASFQRGIFISAMGLGLLLAMIGFSVRGARWAGGQVDKPPLRRE